jgi:hypothetical protein
MIKINKTMIIISQLREAQQVKKKLKIRKKEVIAVYFSKDFVWLDVKAFLGSCFQENKK